jgi:hypothetical protein
MPRPGVEGSFCRKTDAKSKLPSCRSAAEGRISRKRSQIDLPPARVECEKAALAGFEHQISQPRARLRQVVELLGNAKDGTMKVMNK